MGDTLVRDYLHRLDVAAASLPPDRRSELRQEIADHIAQARAAGDVGNEAALRQLLDRIGDPDDIVVAAREGETSSHRPGHSYPPTDYHPRGISLEITAVMLLTVGSIVPLFGWLAGVVLLRGGELLPGVPEVWRALPDHDALSLARWFGLPSAALDRAAPVALLEAGEVGRVVEAATYVGSR